MPRAARLAAPLHTRWRVLLRIGMLGCAVVLASARSTQATEPSRRPAAPRVTATSATTASTQLAAPAAPAAGLPPFLDVPGASVSYPTGAVHGPYGVAVSPDGANVYAADYGNDRLVVFARDTATGSIAVLQTVINGAGGVSGVDGPYLVTVSPDGKNVYVTGSVTDTVVSFARSQTDGALTYLSKLTRNDGYGFCNPTCPFALNALDGAFQVAISPDGAYGYVSSILDNRVVVLARDAVTGALAMNPLSGPAQIFTTSAADLSQAYGMAISPDGAHLYLAGYGSDTLLVLARDPSGGTLVQVEAYKNGQAGVNGLNGVFRVAISPDGRHVYTASFDGNAVTAFQREAATGKLTFLASYTDGANGLDGLGFTSAVAVTPDGARVLASGFNDDAIAVFDRNPATGLLVQSQVVRRDAATQLPALDGVRDVAISADGQSVYAAGYNDNRVVAFQASNPLPALVSATVVSNGDGTATLVVDGSGFVSGATAQWNGVAYSTSVVDSTRLTLTLTVSDVLGTPSLLTITNPAPGGGVSNELLVSLWRAVLPRVSR